MRELWEVTQDKKNILIEDPKYQVIFLWIEDPRYKDIYMDGGPPV